MDVFLVIKSPSQNISDLTVHCKLNWSIQDVKEHITVVYPTKPKKEYQKLIYCGRLLPDHLKLKDMLPNENGLTHILHLVCNIPSSNSDTTDSPRKKANQTNTERLSTSTDVNSFSQTQTSGLNFDATQDRRNIDGYFDRTHEYSMSNPNNVQPQMIAMQQAYLQFLNQYMLYVQSNGLQNVPNTASVSNHQTENREIRNDVSNARPNNDQNNPANNVQNVPGGADANEVRPNRDFLDMVYVVARVTLLITMLGFYSSLRRILLVAGIALLLHLLHKRTQRRRNENAQRQRPQEANAPSENSSEDADQRPVDEDESAQHSEMERNTETSSLALIRTFIIGFFSSLIPEAHVQVN